MKKLFVLLIIISFAYYSNAKVIYVGENADFNNIQDAINVSLPGDKIIVMPGIYNGFTVNKELWIEGKDAFIYGSIKIIANNVTLNNFIVCNAKYGIKIGSDFNKIVNCTIYNNTYGINVFEGIDNEIVGNKVFKNFQYGIKVEYGNRNKIISNDVYRNSGYGIYLLHANDCYIYSNIVEKNYQAGIRLQTSEENIVEFNHVANNQKGIYLCCWSKNNRIFRNNFINNTVNAYCSNSQNNEWQYKGVGNYWSDLYGERYEIDDNNIDFNPVSIPWNISGFRHKIYIIYPKENEIVKGEFFVKGISEIEKSVWFKIDNSSWMLANGTFSWKFLLDTAKLNNGEHTIYVKAGNETVWRKIYVKNEKKTPSFELLYLIIAILIARRLF